MRDAEDAWSMVGIIIILTVVFANMEIDTISAHSTGGEIEAHGGEVPCLGSHS